jgi:LPXTG-motif cell wall-anchored protein
MSLAGNTSGNAGIVVSEVLSNGVTLSLNGAGSTSAVFAPIAALGVIKDQFNFAAAGSFATTSILQNGFSVTAVPGPITGAGLPALLALGGFVWARRRKVQQGTALPA